MNPNSNYYLAINTGFPNAYDRANDRHGGFLVVHGRRLLLAWLLRHATKLLERIAKGRGRPCIQCSLVLHLLLMLWR